MSSLGGEGTRPRSVGEREPQLADHRVACFVPDGTIQDRALLVDIRDDDQRRASARIPGALVLPRNSLEWRCDPDSPWRHPVMNDRSCPLILICSEGFQSSLAAATLYRTSARIVTPGQAVASMPTVTPRTPSRINEVDVDLNMTSIPSSGSACRAGRKEP
jgi:hypothetical protein